MAPLVHAVYIFAATVVLATLVAAWRQSETHLMLGNFFDGSYAHLVFSVGTCLSVGTAIEHMPIGRHRDAMLLSVLLLLIIPRAPTMWLFFFTLVHYTNMIEGDVYAMGCCAGLLIAFVGSLLAKLALYTRPVEGSMTAILGIETWAWQLGMLWSLHATYKAIASRLPEHDA
jgi:hypothetical protein